MNIAPKLKRALKATSSQSSRVIPREGAFRRLRVSSLVEIMVAVTATWAVGQSKKPAVTELGVMCDFLADSSQVTLLTSFLYVCVAALMIMM